MSDIQREAFERWCLDNKIELFTKNWRDDDVVLISLGKIFSLHKATLRHRDEQDKPHGQD